MIRRLLFFIFIGAVFFFIGMWRLSDGFSLAKIFDPLPYSARWDVKSPSSFQIRAILSQPFYYSGKGSQAYVFESADHQYILKLFRLDRYRLPAFQKALPLPGFLAAIQNKRLKEKQINRDKLFASCKLAYDELKEECGLIYLHLNKTTHLTQQVVLYDNLKRQREIEIDKYPFIIQRKAELVYPYLGRLIKEDNTIEVKKALIRLSALLDKREEKGIADGDTVIYKNAGFLDGKPIFLDVGQFEKSFKTENRERVMRKLLLWLKRKDPNLASEAQKILTPLS